MADVLSSDQTKIHYESVGQGPTALLFVHGWLGSSQWWNGQRDYFADHATVVQMDLPGHGQSEAPKNGYSAKVYAEAIRLVSDQIVCENIILVGHSMAGAFALEASLSMSKVKEIVLVDTLKNLDQQMSYQQADQMIFSLYRADFKAAVETVLAEYLFAKSTPPQVKERLQREFLASDADRAIKLIEPLYLMDIQNVARRVTVPVRAINSDFTPTNSENNRKYLKDYGAVTISGTGHYPMLERPDEFNQILEKLLQEFRNATRTQGSSQQFVPKNVDPLE